METWVQRGADDYARAIENELPVGEAWPRDPDGDLMKWVGGCAQIYGTVAQRSADLLLRESDPRATIELLPEWERAFGLPDDCNAEVLTIQVRRQALVNRITEIGGQSIAYFQGIATALGYQVTIYEYLPYMCGLSVCGETRPAGELTYVYAQCGVAECSVSPMCDITLYGGDDWTWRLGAPELRYYWRVSILNTRLTYLRAGTGESGVDHMCEFGLATDLECLIRRYKPAHTEVIFDYSQTIVAPAPVSVASNFSSDFSSAFSTSRLNLAPLAN